MEERLREYEGLAITSALKIRVSKKWTAHGFLLLPVSCRNGQVI
jgi:hypothetical protein